MQSRSKGQLSRTKRKGEKAPSIVLVDDDPKVIELLQIALSSCGYRTFTASEGEEALCLIEKVKPDVIVLDVRLPKKNGYQVCEAVKSDPKTRSIPIIMISGLVEPSARVQGLRCGAEDYLTKPFSPKELLLRVQKILLRVSEARSTAIMSAELERELMDRDRRLGLAQNKLTKRVERVATLAELGRRMTEASDRDELAERLILSLQICLRTSTALVALRRPMEDQFVPFKYHGISGRRVHNLAVSAHGKLYERLNAERRVLAVDELDSVVGLREELLPVRAAGLSMGILARGLDEPAAMIFVGADLEGEGFGKEQREDLESLARFFETGLACLQREEKERESLVDTVAGLVDLIECETPQRRGHSHRVARYAESIAQALGMSPRDMQEVRLTALLHEVKGAGPTTPEFEKCECANGVRCTCSDGGAEPEGELSGEKASCKCSASAHHDNGAPAGERRALSLVCSGGSASKPASSVGLSWLPAGMAGSLRHLRERYDGRGMPHGLRAEEIPLQARILAVADTFDDCLNHGWSVSPVDQAIRSLRGLSGANLDPNIVEVLVHHILSGEIILG
jgi:response regulator RpfG family c-di-GMP phosphodiesterase